MNNNPKVEEIIQSWLMQNGYTGLFYSGECACEIDDLFPCGEIERYCEAGYKVDCTENCNHDDLCDWHIQREKPNESG